MNDFLRLVPLDVGKKMQNLGLGHADRGILPSEMVAVCGIVERSGVTRIIESGRWLGYSTQMLAAYFADTSMVIDSIEYYRTDIGEQCEARLKPYHNVTLYYGDTMKLLPGMLENRMEKTAILIDGPKGAKAVGLVQMIMKWYPQVTVVFLHDAYMGSEARGAIQQAGLRAEYTDDKEFVNRFSFLDADISIGSVHPEKYSGTPETLPSKSYGPTLALIKPTTEQKEVISRTYLARWMTKLVFVYGLLEAKVRGVLYTIKQQVK